MAKRPGIVAALLVCAAVLTCAGGCSYGTTVQLFPYPGSSPHTQPAVVPSVTTVSLDAAGQRAAFTVSEPSYSGAFTANSSKPAVASITPATTAPGSHPATFTVQAGQTAGTTTITVSGASGAPVATITVTVNITQGVVQ